MQKGIQAQKPRRDTPNVSTRWYVLTKTVLDVPICLLLMPLALPVMVVIAAAIVIDSGRPVFFVQERVGLHRRTFRMYKFRTLRRDYDVQLDRKYLQDFVRGRAEDRHGCQAHKPFDKGQVTRVGRILRRTSLDELPQLFNVLRRDMSLIGPRPNLPCEVDVYEEWHNERFTVLPGISGLAQVRGRSNISFAEIVRYDLEYIRNGSLLLDLRILWWTLLAVLGGRGAH